MENVFLQINNKFLINFLTYYKPYLNFFFIWTPVLYKLNIKTLTLLKIKNNLFFEIWVKVKIKPKFYFFNFNTVFTSYNADLIVNIKPIIGFMAFNGNSSFNYLPTNTSFKFFNNANLSVKPYLSLFSIFNTSFKTIFNFLLFFNYNFFFNIYFSSNFFFLLSTIQTFFSLKKTKPAGLVFLLNTNLRKSNLFSLISFNYKLI